MNINQYVRRSSHTFSNYQDLLHCNQTEALIAPPSYRRADRSPLSPSSHQESCITLTTRTQRHTHTLPCEYRRTNMFWCFWLQTSEVCTERQTAERAEAADSAFERQIKKRRGEDRSESLLLCVHQSVSSSPPDSTSPQVINGAVS